MYTSEGTSSPARRMKCSVALVPVSYRRTSEGVNRAEMDRILRKEQRSALGNHQPIVVDSREEQEDADVFSIVCQAFEEQSFGNEAELEVSRNEGLHSTDDCTDNQLASATSNTD